MRATGEGLDGLFLPNFCGIRAVFALVIMSELLAFVLVLSSAQSPLDPWSRLSLISLFVQWVALASAGLFCVSRPWLVRVPKPWVAILAYLLLLAVTAAVSELAVIVLPDGGLGSGLLADSDLGFLLRNLAISALVCAVVLRYFYIQHQWRSQIEAESQARLEALQARIRPHFLFNSMNTIASLTRSAPGVAEEVVQDLADLFRVSLSSARTETTLAEELMLGRQYLRIERHRLGVRLRVEWDCEELPQDALLPPLTLQPLLENAVYHGVEPSPVGGDLVVQGRRRHGQLSVAIRNSLPSAGVAQQRKGNRMAVQNIEERLLGFFQGEARLAVSLTDDSYQVRLLFPYRRRIS
jgi:two-component system sensor histidine kinase AlgZ